MSIFVSSDVLVRACWTSGKVNKFLDFRSQSPHLDNKINDIEPFAALLICALAN